MRLLEKGKEYGLNAVFPFKTDIIKVAEWVHLKCRYGCKQFNMNWCCPPSTPSPDRVRSILKEYELALLLIGICVASFVGLNGQPLELVAPVVDAHPAGVASAPPGQEPPIAIKPSSVGLAVHSRTFPAIA